MASIPEITSRGFVKILRSEVTDYLLRDKNAMHLLTVVAVRARWSAGVSLDGLGFGQAMVGDHEAYGMTRKEYRCAATRLSKLGLAKFEGTPRGTVATLNDSRVFSIRDERHPAKMGQQKGQPEGHLFSEVNQDTGASTGATFEASEGPTKGQRGATKKQDKQERMNTTSATPAKPVAQERDQLFEALARAEGSNPLELTKSGARRVAVALADIRRVAPDLTITEIGRRARVYRNVMPSGTRITANALAANWAKCSGQDTNPPTHERGPDTPPETGWRTRLEDEYPGNRINADKKPWSDVPPEVRVKLWPQRYVNGHHHAAA